MLEEQGSIFHTTTDSEVIAYLLVRERLRTPSIEAGFVWMNRSLLAVNANNSHHHFA